MRWEIEGWHAEAIGVLTLTTVFLSVLLWQVGVEGGYFGVSEGLQKIAIYGLLKLIIFVAIVLMMYVVLWKMNKKNKRIRVTMYIGSALFCYVMIFLAELLTIITPVIFKKGYDLSEMFTWTITISTLIFVVLFALRTKQGINWEDYSYFKRKIRFKKI